MYQIYINILIAAEVIINIYILLLIVNMYVAKLLFIKKKRFCLIPPIISVRMLKISTLKIIVQSKVPQKYLQIF